MAFSSVIEFGGQSDDLVWKSPIENFTATSQLVVDDTHEAVLVVNGIAADSFSGGTHTLSVPNLPMLGKIINLPTDGKTPFPCKVFYINLVHQMDLLWGTQGAIVLEDPLYDVFLHVMLNGSVCFSISNPRKFLLKLTGFVNSVKSNDLVAKFRGIISSKVKDIISKIMINGQISYFVMNTNLEEVSQIVSEKLSEIFDDYGIKVEFFNVETIDVPEKDYAAITASKERRSGRIIEGYTWQEERQMIIAEKFASNEGSMGAMGGMIGGAMGGVMMGGTLSDIARNALSSDRIPAQAPPKDLSGTPSPMGTNRTGRTVSDLRSIINGSTQNAEPVPAQNTQQANPYEQQTNPYAQQTNPYAQQTNSYDQKTVKLEPPVQAPASNSIDMTGAPMIEGINPFDFGTPGFSAAPAGGSVCSNCGNAVPDGAKFCPNCGSPINRSVCPSCGAPVTPNQKFCSNCGHKF